MEVSEIVKLVFVGVAVILASQLEKFLNFIKDLFGKKNPTPTESECDPCVATKSDLKIMKLEILKEVDETRASKAEVQEMRGKLEDISRTTNSTNTTVAVMAVQMTNLQSSIETLFRKADKHKD